MLGAREDRVSAPRRKLAQALEQDRLLSPQESCSERSFTDRDNRSRERRSFEKPAVLDAGARDAHQGEKLLFVASPPLNRKPEAGMRPFAGRSPPRGGFQREVAQEHGDEDVVYDRIAARADWKRKQDSSSEGSSSSRGSSSHRRSRSSREGSNDARPRNAGNRTTNGSNNRGKRNTGREGWRSAAAAGAAAAGDAKEQDLDIDGASLARCLEDEHDDKDGAREKDRKRQESVRKAAETFVGFVFEDLSSPAALSRMSLSLK